MAHVVTNAQIESIKLATFGKKKKAVVAVLTKVVTDVCRSLCNVSEFNQTLDFCIDFNKSLQSKI